MGRVVRLVLINLAVLVVGLAAVELAFGGWVGGRNWGTLVVPKNTTRSFDTSKLYGGGEITYRRDKHGLRGDFGAPGDVDILTIGGSTTNEIFIGEGEIWSAVLAKELSRFVGRRVRVANAGVDGQSTVGNLKNFDLWFPKIPNLRPRYVLAYLGINDLSVIEQGSSRTKQDKLVDPHNADKQYLMNNSVLYATFRNVRGMLRARDAKLIHGTESMVEAEFAPVGAPPDLLAVAEKHAAGLDAYAARLRDLAAAIRAFGARPIFVTQHAGDYRIDDAGDLWGVLGADGRADPGRYALLTLVNWRTMAVCREVDAVCVDLADALRFVEGDHYDAVHTTPRGSEKVGRNLARLLREEISL